MKRIGLLFTIPILLCSVSAAKPSFRHLTCYEVFGATILPEQIRRTKSQTFPFIDPEASRQFESGLTFLSRLQRPFTYDQCNSSCGPYTKANFYNYMWDQGSTDPISASFVTATTFLVKFQDALSERGRSVLVGTIDEADVAVGIYGLATEKLYPSSPDVDTERLASVLTGMAQAFWQDVDDGTPAGDIETLRNQYIEVAQTIVQRFFGQFPEPADFAQVPYDSTKNLLTMLRVKYVEAESVEIGSGKHSYEQLVNGPIMMTLNRGWPILFSYSYKHNLITPEGVYISKLDVVERNRHGAVIDGVAIDADNRLLLRISNTHANAPTLWLPAQMLDSISWRMELLIPLSERAQWKVFLK